MTKVFLFGSAEAGLSIAELKQQARRAARLRCRPLPLGLKWTSWIVLFTQLLTPYYGQLFAATVPTAQATPPAFQPENREMEPKLTPNRTMPQVKPPSLTPEFSASPSDTEFFHAHLFSLPLMPLGAKTSVEENRTLAQALLVFAKRSNHDDASAIKSFLDENPHSAWRASLLYNLGKMYRSTGYISRSIDTWEQVWALVKSDPSDGAKIIGEAAVGELAELYGRLGRAESAEKLLADLAGRDISGPPAGKLFAARQGLWVMKHQPEKGFMCGPYALSSVLAARGEKDIFPPVLQKTRSTTNGTSLAQLKHWSDEMGMHMQMGRRLPGSEILVPAVVNWKAGHFAALVKKEGNRVLMKDPIFEQELWMSEQALDDECSGYFLVPEGKLPAGWEGVGLEEARGVWGKGAAHTGSLNFQRPNDTKVKPCPTSAPGMAQYNINAMLASLTVFDTPVGYQPPRGPRINFTITYDQFDVSSFGTTPTVGNMGPNFNNNYVSYIAFNSSSSFKNLYVRGGGEETYIGYDTNSQNFAMQEDSKAILHQNSSSNFVRYLPDGSYEIYDFPITLSGEQIVFLTQIVDPLGNAVSLTYDGNYRLTTIQDAIGQTNTITYASSDPAQLNLFYKMAQITDPFGRSTYFSYNTNSPYLLNQITDVIGITSSFTYTNGYMSALITPYGTTTFSYGGSTNDSYALSIQATDPEGNSERAEFNGNLTSSILSTELTPTNILSGSDGGNGWLPYRNTFYWDKNAMQQAPGDYTRAKIFHWLHLTSGNGTSHVLESEKAPLESRVWYRYPGEYAPDHYEAGVSNSSPAAVSRILDDGTTQLYQYEYTNIYGKMTKAIDPIGRTTLYAYAANGNDLIQVRQVNGTNQDILRTITYNSQHLPLTLVDASGQTNSFAYNSYGQLTALTNTLGQMVTLLYDSNGYLTNLVGSLPGATNAFTYDSNGRVHTTTDSSGYTLTYAYDNLDRVTKITHPDGTYEQIVYHWLDPILNRDRRGHWTTTTYDTLRRVRDIRDSLNRVTHLEWCGCGSLSSITDPLGNTTTWLRDIEGRPTSKVFPDQTLIQYAYGPNSGRLTGVTDAKNQTTAYNYFGDGNLSQVNYSNALMSTPGVSYTYDTNYNRMLIMADGVGVTSNYYNPITVPPTLGAGRLASVAGPVGNSVVTYNYDALGRVTNRAINGVGMNVAFDALGRMLSNSNALGVFSNAYVGATMRLSSVAYPNGQGSTFSYFGTNNDLRLQTIWHTNAAGGTISKFDYTYDADGQIQTWIKQADTSSTNTFTFQYDPTDQLLGAVLAQTGAPTNILHQYLYNYDPNGNRTGEQVDTAPVGAHFNNLNQLTNQINNGLVQFSGNITKTGVVSVAGNRGVMTSQTNFAAYVVTQPGTNPVRITATDLNGNTGVSNYQLVVTNNTVSRTLFYDLDGNQTTNAASTGTSTYEWDAQNRLTAVNEAGTNRSEFTYDGAGRRVKIVEKTNGVAYSTKTFVWCGSELREERDATGTNVTKRFFGQGEQISGTNYYFTKDHLGSIREMTDAGGTIHARYDYDPYGRLTKVSGDMEADFGFTGHYRHAQSGLLLTIYRAYDPNTDRWLNRDPIEERGGINLYAYVANNPIFFFDPLGLELGNYWDVGATMNYLNQASANGLNQGGIGGYASFIGAQLAEDLIGFSGADSVADSSSQSGAASADPCHHGAALGYGVLTAGTIALAAIPGNGPDANALIQLAKDARRYGISPQDAEILLQWAKEYNINPALDHIGTTHWVGGDHIRIGPINHIPVK